MQLQNIDVRLIIGESGFKYGDVARQMRITPTWLSHLLRYPLSQKDKARILTALKELHEGTKHEF